MVTLRIESGREGQHVGGTELHTERAALTAFHIDGNKTLGHRTLHEVFSFYGSKLHAIEGIRDLNRRH
jgi:hypothetical protein